MATLEAIHEKEMRNNKFAAAMQGIDLDEDNEEEAGDVASSGGTLDMFGMGYEQGD